MIATGIARHQPGERGPLRLPFSRRRGRHGWPAAHKLKREYVRRLVSVQNYMLTKKKVEKFEPTVPAPPTHDLLSHYHDGNIAAALFIVSFGNVQTTTCLHGLQHFRLSMHRDTKSPKARMKHLTWHDTVCPSATPGSDERSLDKDASDWRTLGSNQPQR